MSFLAGRLAATEGAYFRQESKHVAERLSHKNKKQQQQQQQLPSPNPTDSKTTTHEFDSDDQARADVLHEVLRHSLPTSALQPLEPSPPSLSPASQWRPSPSPSHSPPSLFSDAANPLRSVVSLPQVTFGPRRWTVPSGEHSVLASTANELRRDRYTNAIDPKKLKAAAEGLSQIGKSFAVATTIVFGGATLAFMLIASQLQLRNTEDVKTIGRDLLQPRFETVRGKVGPLRDWAENMSKKWHVEGEGQAMERPIIVKELSKRFGAKTPN